MKLASFPNIVVLVENTSNMQHERFIHCIDRTLNGFDPSNEAFMPQILITVGGAVVSKRIKAYLRNAGIQKHYKIGAEFPEMDTYRCLSKAILISPSDLSRGDRMTKGKVIKSCNKTRKSCKPGRESDACFDDDFLQKNPSIVGWIGIGRADSIQINKEIETGELQNVKEFIHLVKDKRNIKGPPELALYPLKSRQAEDVKNIDIASSEYNYERIKSLPRNHEVLIDFLNNNATHVKGKWYYTYKL
jgi:hypothetical protein